MGMSEKFSFTDLPSELIIKIGENLDFGSLRALRCTSRKCNQVLYDIEKSKLFPEQLEHCKKLRDCLLKYGRAYDTSIMGSGKTYMACFVAYMLEKKIIVVSPKILFETWKTVTKEYNIRVIKTITYNALSRNKYYDHSSGTLNEDFSELLNNMKDKLMFIFDECSVVRNITKQTKSIAKIVNILYDLGIPVLFLSSTPFDKSKSIISLFNTLGVISSIKVSNATVYNDCYTEMSNFVSNVLKEKFSVDSKYISGRKKLRLFYHVYKKYILKNLIFCINNFKVESKLDLKIVKYRSMNQVLVNSLQLQNLYNTFNLVYSVSNFQTFTIALKRLEELKVEIFIRLAKEKIAQNYKVICILNFKENIVKIQEELKNYCKLLVIEGNTEDETRTANINEFNNNKNVKLLIASMKLLSYGISLHDKRGDSPRFMLISPNFSLLDILQASRRIYRRDVKSDCIVRIVFIEGLNFEKKIYSKLWEKSTILKLSLGKDLIPSNEAENCSENEDQLYVCNVPLITENNDRLTVDNETKFIQDKISLELLSGATF